MAKRRRGRGEGTVHWSEAKGCWRARAIVGQKPSGAPRYKEVTAKTKGEVLAKMRQAEADAKAGRGTSGDTLGAYLLDWLNNVSKPSVDVSTWASYERCVRLHMIPRVGGVRLAQLRPAHIESLFASMHQDGVSGGHAKKVSEVLSSALEYAVGSGRLPANPAASVPKPKPDAKEIQIFTPAEVQRIRQAAQGHRLEAMFVLAIATGAREGELLALGWEHVDLDAGTIAIRRTLDQIDGRFVLKEKPKSKRGLRDVHLPRFAVAALLAHREAMRAEGHLSAPVVFCTSTGNFIGRSNFVRKVHRPLLAKSEVPYRKFHTFRHTHVSELLARGESVVDVAQRVGDSVEVILRTYAHFIPGAGKKLAGRLDEMYGG